MNIQASSIGLIAADTLANSNACIVRAQFSRSIHCEIDGNIVCLVEAALGNGPVNITVPPHFLQVLRKLTIGARGTIADQSITWEHGPAVTWRHAKSWRPPSCGLPSLHLQVAQWKALIDIGFASAPPDSFFHAAFGNFRIADDTLMRAARTRINALMQWMDNPRDEPPVMSLIGLGSGLTPSGDDVIGGILLALYAMGNRDMLKKISCSVKTMPDLATTALSRTLLHAACEGIGHEYVHDLLSAMQSGSAQAMKMAAIRMNQIGHSSGWDTLAGLLLGCAAGKKWLDPAQLIGQPESCVA